MIEQLLAELTCRIRGHDFDEWDTFSYLPEGATGWVTTASKCRRYCDRCGLFESREWSDEEKELLKEMRTRQKAPTGEFGHISGTRFISTLRKDEIPTIAPDNKKQVYDLLVQLHRTDWGDGMNKHNARFLFESYAQRIDDLYRK